MSRGKNMRSPASASCHVPCELLSCESCVWVLSDGDTCACAKEIKTGKSRIQAHFFISPPNRVVQRQAENRPVSLASRTRDECVLVPLLERNIVTCHTNMPAARPTVL